VAEHGIAYAKQRAHESEDAAWARPYQEVEGSCDEHLAFAAIQTMVYLRHVHRFLFWSREQLAKLREPGPAMAALATLWFACVCLWEAWGPPDCGHFCSTAQVAMGGLNMWRWHIWGAVPHLLRERPGIGGYYTHHPYGVFISAALFTKLLGPSAFALRASGIVHGIFTPIVLYKALVRLVPKTAAGFGTLVFVLVPIDLAFARFGNLEGVTMLWGLVFTWATLELLYSWKKRFLLLTLLGALGCVHGDWIGSVFIVLIAGTFLFCGFIVRPRQRWDHQRMSLWLLAVLVGLGSIVTFFVPLIQNGQLSELVGSGSARSSGSELPLASVFNPRRTLWIHWTLPLYALWLAPMGACVGLVQLLRRDLRGVFALAWFVMASVQYFLFKQGADIHIFWPHYYGICVAFGASYAAVAASWCVRVLRSWAGSVGIRKRLSRAWILVPGMFALFAVVLGREGIAQLRQGRITSGRFDEGGNFVDSLREHAIATRWAYASLPRSFDVTLHPSVPLAPHLSYVVDRPLHAANPGRLQPGDPARYALFDRRAMTIAELRDVAKTAELSVVGPFGRADRAAPFSGVPAARAYRWTVRAPTALEFLTQVGTEPMFVPSDQSDPYASWELMSELGRSTPDLEPPSVNASPADFRVYCNYMRERGDRERAESACRSALEGTTRLDLSFDKGVVLRSYRVENLGGVFVTLYFETGADFQPIAGSLRVLSNVTEPPALWQGHLDYFTREILPPSTTIHAEAWKPRHLYEIAFKVPKRIGLEVFTGELQLDESRSEKPLFRLR
jgi:hypothetical protein